MVSTPKVLEITIVTSHDQPYREPPIIQVITATNMSVSNLDSVDTIKSFAG